MEGKIVESSLILWVFLIPVILGVVIFFTGRFGAFLREGLASVGVAASFIISLLIAKHILKGEVITFWNENLRADGLSTLMILLASLMGTLVLIYSQKYIKEHPRLAKIKPKLTRYYAFISLFLGMVNWTCVMNNFAMLYISMEFTTLSAAFLVIFYFRRSSLEAGFKYVMLVTAGMAFALLGCILIYSAKPGLLKLTDMAKLAETLPPSTVLLACAFFVVGFGTKAGLVPFHAWLPDAHAEAPAPVSALLSGIVIKVGAYALARTITVFAEHYHSVVVFVAILSSASMLIGIFMALVQDDVKRMLAWSSISQIAFVVEGLGLGTYLGVFGGMFHIINHTLNKALLFLSVGALTYYTGIRSIRELGALKKSMPITAFCFLVGAISISGLPPLNGFVSKFTLFVAAAKAGLLWASIIAILTGLLTTACFGLAVYKIFWVKPAQSNEVREVPASMLACMLVLAILCIAVGLFPNIVNPLLDKAATVIMQIR